MPLPKMPTKPATLLPPEDYPKADKNKRIKPAIALVESLPQAVEIETDEIIRAKGYLWFAGDEDHGVLFEQAGNSIAITPGARWIVSYPENEREELLEEYPELLEGWDEKDGDRENQIVFIGRNIDIESLNQVLDSFLKNP